MNKFIYLMNRIITAIILFIQISVDAKEIEPVWMPGLNELHIIDVSSDGKHFATGGNGGVFIWSLETGKITQHFKDPVEYYGIAFSPDGTQLLAGGEEHATLWDVLTGKHILTIPYSARAVDFSPDGKQILLEDKLININTLEIVMSFNYKKGIRQGPVKFSPDGSKIITPHLGEGAHDVIRVWNTQTGALIHTLSKHTGHGGPIFADFSADGKRLFTGGWNGLALLWDLETGEIIRQYTENCNSIALAKDEKTVLTGSDGTISQWDVETGEWIQTFGDYSTPIRFIQYATDGNQVFCGSVIGILKLWDLSSSTVIRNFAGHLDGIDSYALSPDSTIFITLADNMHCENTILFWDLTGQTSFIPSFDIQPETSMFAFSSNGLLQMVYTLNDESTILDSIDMTSGEIMLTKTFPSNKESTSFFDLKFDVFAFTSSFDGKLNVTGHKGKVSLWDAETGETIRDFSFVKNIEGWGLIIHPIIDTVHLSEDGKILLAGGVFYVLDSGNLYFTKIFDVQSGDEILDSEMKLSGYVNKTSLALLEDNSRAYLIDIITGEILHEFGAFCQGMDEFDRGIFSSAISPDGSYVITSGRTETGDVIQLWNASSGEIIHTLDGKSTYTEFIPDGSGFITGTRNTAMYLWNLNDFKSGVTNYELYR